MGFQYDLVKIRSGLLIGPHCSIARKISYIVIFVSFSGFQ